MTQRPRARAIRTPPGITTTDVGSFRMVAGSIGAAQTPLGPPPPVMDPAQPEQEPDDSWADELRRREAAAGFQPVLTQESQDWVPPAAPDLRPGPMTFVERPTGPTYSADLSPLPDRFTLDLERKPSGQWIVRAPAVHVGLFVADTDLAAALASVPATLARIVGIDGIVAAPKPGRPKK